MPDDFPIPRQDGPDGRQESTGDDPRRSTDDSSTTPDGASIVSWGDRPRTGRRAGLALHRISRDGRLVPVVGAAGAAAVLASLIGDWAVTTMPVEAAPSDSPITLASGVADLSAFGTAYLVSVFGVIGCLALVFFGSPGVRHNARVAGLAVAGAVLGLLLAITGTLDSLADRWQVYGQLEGLTTTYGQGLVMAYLGTGALGLALLLAGRFIRQPVAEPGSSDGTAGPISAEEADWPWRRPRTATAPEPPDDDDGRPAPIDLTVTPTKPFAR